MIAGQRSKELRSLGGGYRWLKISLDLINFQWVQLWHECSMPARKEQILGLKLAWSRSKQKLTSDVIAKILAFRSEAIKHGVGSKSYIRSCISYD